MTNTIPTYTLSNGVEIPLLGFGTFAKGRTPGMTYDAVTVALEAGYRHLDCAWFYSNEDEVGSALKEWLAKNPKSKRSDIFITTKVWPHLCGSAEDIEWSLNDSLRLLGTDYVDCFLVHWPIAVERTEDHQPKKGPEGKYILKKDLTDNPELIWSSMEKLYETGKARSIAVSNWTVKKLENLLASAKIKPVVNQIEIHPFLPNTELVEFCLSKSILPVAYSPLGSHHAIPATGERITTNPALNDLAKKKDCSVAQILIAWGLKRGYGVLPKSATADRIKSNLVLVELSDEEFTAVNRYTEGRNHRFCDLESLFGLDAWDA